MPAGSKACVHATGTNGLRSRRRGFGRVRMGLATATLGGLVLCLLAGCPTGDPTLAGRAGDDTPPAATQVPSPTPTSGSPDGPAGGPPVTGGPDDCCIPVGFGGNPGGNNHTPGEIAAVLFQIDTDDDGESDGSELARGADPNDPTDGDVDGDGLINADDRDVDGDGIPNGEDDDIDGDGIANDDDADMDGDGLENPEDDDDDGDGIDDAADEDDNADGEDDCECEHGVCSDFKGLCYCDSGWKGEDCDEFTCKDVNNCNHGKCIGPNSCGCDAGWESGSGGPCNQFHCRDYANCSGHGTCSGPNVCVCDDDWRGTPDCHQHTCVRTPSVCDDGDPCTDDECDATSGCSHKPKPCAGDTTCVDGVCVFKCDDRSECADGEACRQGGCVDDCAADSDCRDGDDCTGDVCNSEHECENEPVICPLPEDCVRGRCVDACENDFDCEFNEFCVDGGCFAECDSDSDCAEDETCDTREHACLPADDQSEDEDGQ